MSRVQLALNVSDINEAVEFYTKLFGTGPAKRQPGYANFAVTDPPLKLVLMEDTSGRGTGIVGALNHLGVEVETPDEVAAATGRLSNTGIETEVQEQTACCYAVQDKVWVSDPDGAPWESTPSSPTPRPRPASPATGRAVFPRQSAACPPGLAHVPLALRPAAERSGSRGSLV